MPTAPRQKPTEKRAERPFCARAFVGSPTSIDVDSRSFDVVIATETPVRTYVPNPKITNPEVEDCSDILVDEVLIASGLDMSRAPRMPFIDCHDTWTSIDKILGKVDAIRVEGQAVVGRVTLTRKRADLLADIADGFYGQISAGFNYDVRTDAELVEREGDVPLLIVKRWCLTEASAVPVGADPNAFIRSLYGSPHHQENPMAKANNTRSRKRADEGAASSTPDIDAVVAQAEDAVTAAEAAISALDDAVSAAGDNVPDDVMERAASIRSRFRAADDEVDGDDPENKDDETGGERADGDDEEMTAEEKKDVDEVRAIARSYGLTKLVDDMKALGARSKEIKGAVRSAISGRSAETKSAASARPAARAAPKQELTDWQRSKRSFDKLNGKAAK
ncbi:hypothetical protein HFN53_17060 [Rhizobium leguminosarum]|nr:hypothetical protein [Rhizobium leguminosarum]